MTERPLDPRLAELGVDALDSEHRGQLERMDRLLKAIESDRAVPEVARAMDDFIDHLEAHFMSEQILMRERAYPAYDAHVREHEDAMELLRRLQERWGQGDREASGEILEALRGWLVDHIRTEDAALATFMVSG